MQFASALVEYLVAGIVGLLWLIPFISWLFRIPIQLADLASVVVLPIAYVLGLYIDVTSSFLLRFAKWKPSASPRLLRWFGKPYAGSYGRTIAILAASNPQLLAQTMQSYVSRDRIARCMTLNAMLGILTSIIVSRGPQRWLLVGILVPISFVSFLIWARLERLSSKFKDSAYDRLQRIAAQDR